MLLCRWMAWRLTEDYRLKMMAQRNQSLPVQLKAIHFWVSHFDVLRGFTVVCQLASRLLATSLTHMWRMNGNWHVAASLLVLYIQTIFDRRANTKLSNGLWRGNITFCKSCRVDEKAILFERIRIFFFQIVFFFLIKIVPLPQFRFKHNVAQCRPTHSPQCGFTAILKVTEV